LQNKQDEQIAEPQSRADARCVDDGIAQCKHDLKSSILSVGSDRYGSNLKDDFASKKQSNVTDLTLPSGARL